jgi:DNA-binding protein HU-beta
MPPKQRGAKQKSMTKAQVVSELSSRVGITRAQTTEVFVKLTELIQEELSGGRQVTIPGLVKVSLSQKPATAARQGRNPFTGDNITIKAKPARKVVKVKAIKAMKDMF